MRIGFSGIQRTGVIDTRPVLLGERTDVKTSMRPDIVLDAVANASASQKRRQLLSHAGHLLVPIAGDDDKPVRWIALDRLLSLQAQQERPAVDDPSALPDINGDNEDVPGLAPGPDAQEHASNATWIARSIFQSFGVAGRGDKQADGELRFAAALEPYAKGLTGSDARKEAAAAQFLAAALYQLGEQQQPLAPDRDGLPKLADLAVDGDKVDRITLCLEASGKDHDLRTSLLVLTTFHDELTPEDDQVTRRRVELRRQIFEDLAKAGIVSNDPAGFMPIDGLLEGLRLEGDLADQVKLPLAQLCRLEHGVAAQRGMLAAVSRAAEHAASREALAEPAMLEAWLEAYPTTDHAVYQAERARVQARLEQRTERLREIESALESLREISGGNLERLQDAVTERRQALDSARQNLEGTRQAGGDIDAARGQVQEAWTDLRRAIGAVMKQRLAETALKARQQSSIRSEIKSLEARVLGLDRAARLSELAEAARRAGPGERSNALAALGAELQAECDRQIDAATAAEGFWGEAQALQGQVLTTQQALFELIGHKRQLKESVDQRDQLEGMIDYLRSDGGFQAAIDHYAGMVDKLDREVAVSRAKVRDLETLTSGSIADIEIRRSRLLATIEDYAAAAGTPLERLNGPDPFVDGMDALRHFLSHVEDGGILALFSDAELAAVKAEIQRDLKIEGSLHSAPRISRLRETMLAGLYVDRLAAKNVQNLKTADAAIELINQMLRAHPARARAEFPTPEGSRIREWAGRLRYGRDSTKSPAALAKVREDESLHVYFRSIKDDPDLASSAFLQTLFENAAGSFENGVLYADTPAVVDGLSVISQRIAGLLDQPALDQPLGDQPSRLSVRARLEALGEELQGQRQVLQALAEPLIAASQAREALQLHLDRNGFDLDIDNPRQMADVFEHVERLQAAGPERPDGAAPKDRSHSLRQLLGNENVKKLGLQGRKPSDFMIRRAFQPALAGSAAGEPSMEVATWRSLIASSLEELGQLIAAWQQAREALSDNQEEVLAGADRMAALIGARTRLLSGCELDDGTNAARHLTTLIRAAILTERPQGMASAPFTEEAQAGAPNDKRLHLERFEAPPREQIVARLRSWGVDDELISLLAHEIDLTLAHVSAEVVNIPDAHWHRLPIALASELQPPGLEDGPTDLNWFAEMPTSRQRQMFQALRRWQDQEPGKGISSAERLFSEPSLAERALTYLYASSLDPHVQDRATVVQGPNRTVEVALPFLDVSLVRGQRSSIEIKRGMKTLEIRLRQGPVKELEVEASLGIGTARGAGGSSGSSGAPGALYGTGGARGGRTSSGVGAGVRAEVMGSWSRFEGVAVMVPRLTIHDVLARGLAGRFDVRNLIDNTTAVQSTSKDEGAIALSVGGDATFNLRGVARAEAAATAGLTRIHQMTRYQDRAEFDQKPRRFDVVSFRSGWRVGGGQPLSYADVFELLPGQSVAESVLQEQPSATPVITRDHGRFRALVSARVSRSKTTLEEGLPSKVEFLVSGPINPKAGPRANLERLGDPRFTRIYDTHPEFRSSIDASFRNLAGGDFIGLEYKITADGLAEIMDKQHALHTIQMHGSGRDPMAPRLDETIQRLLNPRKNPKIEPYSVVIVRFQADGIQTHVPIFMVGEGGVAEIGRRIIKNFVLVPGDSLPKLPDDPQDSAG